jgi:hypothetical protein
MRHLRIVEFLKTYVPKITITEYPSYYTMETACHNSVLDSSSHKLYLYKNEEADTPMFNCFTECSESFSIFGFIQKREALNGNLIDWKEAKKIYFGGEVDKNLTKSPEQKQAKEFTDPALVRLPEYSSGILSMFKQSSTDPWAEEGIDEDVLKRFNITYSKSFEGVIIPHLDWRGRLVGIRIRTTNATKAVDAKYMPLKVGSILYSHPLSLNLYGSFQNQKSIKKEKRVYLYEAEKSVLLHESMFGYSNAMAVCGKSLSKWQSDFIVQFLGVEEVIIAFDKEYETIQDAFRWIELLKPKLRYLSNFVKIGIMIDQHNVFQPKESPVDRGIDQFEHMMVFYL